MPSLEEAVNQHGPLPEAMVFRLIAGVAAALQTSQAANVAHRDLNPSRVLLDADGARVTDSGNVMTGAPGFLAPEQVLDLPITPATDVFALGSLAVYAAVGRPPFGDGDVAAISHRVAYEPPDLTGCPAQLLTLIESCLEKQAKDRPSLSRIIEFCVARTVGPSDAGSPWLAWSPPTAPMAEVAGRAAPGPGRRRRIAAGLAAAAALAAAAVIAIVVTSHPATAGNTAAAAAAPAVSRAPTSPSPFPSSALSPSASGSASRSHSASRTRTRTRSVRRVPVRPVVLLSQGHPVTASSIQGYPWATANAVDGNLGTRWSSAWSDPQWLEVDLGATHAIRQIGLYWENAHATAFTIQVSVNGTTWTDIYATTTGAGGTQSLQVSAMGRYVRMYGTRRNTSYGYSLWEFQVFGN